MSQKALRTTLKLLIVRHPFERLLSAFRDKLENKDVGLEHGVKHFYLSYGRKIVQLYRNGSSDRPEPTFREFVTYLIKDDAIRCADFLLKKTYQNKCFIKYL
jgi:chondroitin 4-sulfotransferase 11